MPVPSVDFQAAGLNCLMQIIGVSWIIGEKILGFYTGAGIRSRRVFEEFLELVGASGEVRSNRDLGNRIMDKRAAVTIIG